MNKRCLIPLIGKVNEKVKNFKKSITSTNMGKFRFAIVIDMLIKTILFLLIIESSTADKIDGATINVICIVAYLSFILFVYSFSYLFSKNKQIAFHMVVSILYSCLLIIDLGYFRVNKDLIGLKNIIYNGTFNVMGKSCFNFRLIDSLFIIDIIILFIFLIYKKVNNDEKKNMGKFWYTLKQATILLLISFLVIDVGGLAGWDKRIFTKRRTY